MTQQIMLNRRAQKTDQSYMVGSDAKNALPTNKLGITGADLIGLSWIFTEDNEDGINTC